MAKAKNPKVIMTEAQFVERLEAIKAKKTFYKNKWPYNLCLIAPPKSTKTFTDCSKSKRTNLNPFEQQATSADCVNLLKAILNGYNVSNNTVGYFQRDTSNTGDCTELELLSQCQEISQDFTKLSTHAEILYMKGHVGAYIGKTIQGKYNTIECTANFGGGVVYSWVDPDGTRRKEKGGEIKKKWTHHGKPTRWVSLTKEEPKEDPKPTGQYYFVKSGDTLSGIAKKHGLTLTELLRLNPQIKNPNIIHVGDKITVEVIKIEYTVRKGDTLLGIARSHGMSLQNLLDLNPQIKNPNLITVGQIIRVK